MALPMKSRRRAHRSEIQFLIFLSLSVLHSTIVWAQPDVIAKSFDVSGKQSQGLLREKAKELHRLARKIRVGRESDWNGFYRYQETQRNDCDDASRDLLSTSMAVTNAKIKVMLETRAKPTTAPLAYWLDFDLMGAHVIDFQIGLKQGRGCTFWVYKNGSSVAKTLIRGVKFKLGDRVTVEIPVASIKKAYKATGEELPEDPFARGWVRLRPFSYDTQTKTKTDLGASAATPVLDRDEFFDLPEQAIADTTQWSRSISVPFAPENKWFIGQGADGIWTHKGIFAYDIYMMDATLEPANEQKAKSNQQYYCWEKEIVSPVNARVSSTKNDTVDNEPFDVTRRGDGNSVQLSLGQNFWLRFYHLRENTVVPQPGDLVKKGAILGKVGHSASYTYAHLHLDLFEGRERVPLAFKDVEVSLNHDDHCPWKLNYSNWVIEEGWFVRATR